MTHEPDSRQTQVWEGLYRAYLSARQTTPLTGSFMSYDWLEQEDAISGALMPYRLMLEEFARELANVINRLTNHVHQLRAWDAVLSDRSIEDKSEATHEFIEAIGVAALGLPYVIKSRFAYAAAHLCHQANRLVATEGWVDEFVAKDALYLGDVDPYGRPWDGYFPFKRKVEAIGGKAFKAATGDFRNAYNHRFPRRIVLGETGFIRREIDPVAKTPVYVLGGEAALELSVVAGLLDGECEKAYRAFEGFQILVREHLAAMARATKAEGETEDGDPAATVAGDLR